MELISMTDFVLQNTINYPVKGIINSKNIHKDFYNKIQNYANFLKQPLKLEMFVPCDDEGNVLKDAYDTLGNGHYAMTSEKEIMKINDKYEKAKEKVLFEGIDQGIAEYLCDQFETIEYMVNYCNEELTLTETAKKQIGL